MLSLSAISSRCLVLTVAAVALSVGSLGIRGAKYDQGSSVSAGRNASPSLNSASGPAPGPALCRDIHPYGPERPIRTHRQSDRTA